MKKITDLKQDCIHFKGYKPCDHAKQDNNLDCWNCVDKYAPYDKKILIIKQGEIGDVIRTTPIVRAIKEKWPKSRVTWLVEGKAEQFVLNNPFIDEVVVYHPSQLLRFSIERFDLVICLDKDIASTTIASIVTAQEKMGFGFGADGNIFPFNKEAEYKYMIGVSDNLNKENKLSYMDQIYSLTGLKPSIPDYLFELPDKAKEFSDKFKRYMLGNIIIGINHGCGFKLGTRKWQLNSYAELINRLLKKNDNVKIILIGGPYEKNRQKKLREKIDPSVLYRVIDPGTDNEIMQSCALINLCDIVVTSVTGMMHVALALKKKVVVLMGPIVKAEVDTFGLGPILTSKDHDCLGCFKDECNKRPSCMDGISVDAVYKEVLKHMKVIK